MGNNRIQLAIVDMAGTTVADDGLVLTAFEAAATPYPDLILAALMRLDVDSVFNIAALGDTSSDVESALRAGVSIAAGTITGAHNERQLRDAGATHVVGSVTEFAELVLSA